MNNYLQAFFALVRAGLWEQDVQLSDFDSIDYNKIYRLAEEQSVVGLVAAGLEHVKDVKIPQSVALTFAGITLQLERRNIAMNAFIANVLDQMRQQGIYTILIKGQGVAQCYERPLWRSSGDVDFFLSEENFLKARVFFRPLVANGFDPSNEDARNISAQLPPWDIELHGNQFCGLSQRMDSGINEVQKCIIFDGQVRSWMNNRTQVFLPSADNDVIFIFTHFLKHFYKGGLGLRQICDWCRLLWTYKDSFNIGLLESRLRRMGLMTEWKAFGAFAVDYLGMPSDKIPFYSPAKKWTHKASLINSFVMEVGNMGHKRDMSFYSTNSFLVSKLLSFRIRMRDVIRHARLFPLDSLFFSLNIVNNGVKALFYRRAYKSYNTKNH